MVLNPDASGDRPGHDRQRSLLLVAVHQAIEPEHAVAGLDAQGPGRDPVLGGQPAPHLLDQVRIRPRRPGLWDRVDQHPQQVGPADGADEPPDRTV